MPVSILDPQVRYILIGLLSGIALYQLIAIKYPTIKHIFSLPSPSGRQPGISGRLGAMTTDFTSLAASGHIDPVIGREKEIIRLAQILSRRGKNNAILVGPPGVGKTAIVEGLARRISQKAVPATLEGKRVLALDVAILMSGTKYRGEFEKRAKQIVKEIQDADRKVILFIDEIHSLIQSQGTEGSINFTDILKPALARGDLQMIGATTIEEYEKYIKKDASLERRFQPVKVTEPTKKQTLAILQGVKEKYQTYHHVEFTDAALEQAVVLTKKKIKQRTLPDKAIDAIDEAASMVRVSHIHEAIPTVLYSAAVAKYPHLKKVWQDIQKTDLAILDATAAQKKKLQKKRELLEEKLREKGILVVDASDIELIIDDWSHDIS